MNYYFLPQVPPLTSKVILANFPSATCPSWGSKSVYVHATYSTGRDWKVFCLQEIAAGDLISLCADDVSEKMPAGSEVFFFMYPKRLPESLELLPVDQFMESEPSWRGNIQLSSDTTSVSYQGEYPGTMMNIAKGTLLTFNPLIQTQPNVVTQLIVVSLLRSPEIREGRLFVVHQVSGKIKKECRITTNTCNLIDFSELENDSKDPLCLYSPDMVGIPIFLSHDPSYRFLSLEHSYPLQEITVFGDIAKRMGFLKEVKNYWIDSLGKNVS
jgi:hypothetical protein